MGMVPPAGPAFIRLGDGRILGTPTPATNADSLRITPMRDPKPRNLRQRTVIEKVKAPKAATIGGAAAEGRATTAGTKKTHDPGQESPR